MKFSDYIRLVDRVRNAQIRCAELVSSGSRSECAVTYSMVVAEMLHELDDATESLMRTVCKD